jgi:DNA-binding NarL/FixJ family response regulator
MQTIRVILFDDNPHICDAIGMLLSNTPGIEFINAFPDCNSLEKVLLWSQPDVVLMDIDMPGVDGVQAVALIRKIMPEVRILMQTVFDDSDRIFAAICSGAHGYLLKNTPPSRIIESIHEVFHGGAPMTPDVATKVLKLLAQDRPDSSTDEIKQLSHREKEVLKLLVAGKAYKMIAADLHITYDTVRAHIKKIYEKLHVSSMTEAVAKAIKSRIV